MESELHAAEFKSSLDFPTPMQALQKRNENPERLQIASAVVPGKKFTTCLAKLTQNFRKTERPTHLDALALARFN